MQLILISGLSGSGKSIALAVLEDSGFYCVDNLPAQLLPNIASFLDQAGHTRIAISVDVRSSGTLDQLPQIITQLKEQGFDLRLLFLEAKTDTLVKRFSETRRRHPLSSGQRTLQECIQLEHNLLEPVGDLGHRIDTSDLNPNALRAWIKDFVDFDRSRLSLPLPAQPSLRPFAAPAHRQGCRGCRLPGERCQRAENAGRHPPLRGRMAALLHP
jgi:UPF0042 nucleotide-binding protein